MERLVLNVLKKKRKPRTGVVGRPFQKGNQFGRLKNIKKDLFAGLPPTTDHVVASTDAMVAYGQDGKGLGGLRGFYYGAIQREPKGFLSLAGKYVAFAAATQPPAAPPEAEIPDGRTDEQRQEAIEAYIRQHKPHLNFLLDRFPSREVYPRKDDSNANGAHVNDDPDSSGNGHDPYIAWETGKPN